MNFLAVFLGGAVGATLRYFVILWSPAEAVLWIVNIVGSFSMGALQAYYLQKSAPVWKVFWTTGILGSFTTFSSFSAEWFTYFEVNPFYASIYAIGITISCFLAAFIGFLLLRKRGEQIV